MSPGRSPAPARSARAAVPRPGSPAYASLVSEARSAAIRSSRLAREGGPAPLRGPRGAALYTPKGTFVGVELGGSEGMAFAAERVALHAALLARGGRPTLLVLRGGPRGTGDAGPPTAATLQVLAEFAPDLRVTWGTDRRPRGGQSVQELLPGAFGPAHLLARDGDDTEGHGGDAQ